MAVLERSIPSYSWFLGGAGNTHRRFLHGDLGTLAPQIDRNKKEMVDRGFPSIDRIDNWESADIRQGFTF